jgi:AraC family transcriptional regulator of adaptative response / DNA-3-methyladenine glycosylase II
VAAVLGADPALEPAVERRPGLRVPGAYDGFELAVRALLGQQVTVRGASTLAGRLVALAGTPLDQPVGGLTTAFPTPAAVAEADLSTLGVPGRRAEALRALAEAVASGAVRLDGYDDPAETRAALLALPGIGPWTVEYLALRALRDPDAFPAGDLGLRRSAAALGIPSTEAGLRRHAERWRPWRAYAAVHLWTSTADPVSQERAS